MMHEPFCRGSLDGFWSYIDESDHVPCDFLPVWNVQVVPVSQIVAEIGTIITTIAGLELQCPEPQPQQYMLRRMPFNLCNYAVYLLFVILQTLQDEECTQNLKDWNNLDTQGWKLQSRPNFLHNQPHCPKPFVRGHDRSTHILWAKIGETNSESHYAH